MSVHYKFKAALDFSTVTFDGIHISVSELKKSIIDQKRLGKNADFDLQIINAQTKEVYSDENALIPKNTSVIVARVPVTDRKKSGPPPSAKDNAPGRGMHHKAAFHQQSGAEVAKGSDLSSMDLTEEEKIKAMMTQSTADYDPSHYVRIRGANQHGRVPESYRCNKCNQGGHWINRCPNAPPAQPDVKKSTGIPRSFMVVVDSPDFPGALMTPEGRYAVPAVDHAAYLEKNKGQQTVEQPVKPKIPDDLVCPLCNDLLTDALLVPCCANSYCDDCIRNYLVESEHECPGCHEKDISPTSLIPNRFLRGTVNAFKSDTGYSKPEKVPERPQKSPPKPDHPKIDESRKLSLDELPDDLFPHSPKKIDSETEGNNNTDPEESTKDLYDFNDGSIPSPFASPKRAEAKVEVAPVEQRAIQSLSRPFQGPVSGMMRGPSGAPPPPHPHHPPHPGHHMVRKPHPTSEPPPPGFEMLPPGEDISHRPHGANGGPQGHPNVGHENRQDGPPSGPNRGPPQQQQPGPGQHHGMPPNVPPPFNPMQPPPGYPGGMPPGHGPPQGHPHGGPPGLPPPGFGPPGGPPPGPSQNMPPYGNNYNRGPPPPHMARGPPPGHHGGPPPRHHMDHDDFGHRGRGRRPYGHGGPPPHRMDEPHRDREEESRSGIIDDPLKEFERLMREKDRRKKMAQSAGARKRSKSRSFSPGPRRISPYHPKRSRSRSFSKSPSPKRKRPPPGPKRRRSYSRSPSRSPRPLRRVGKSRSRSRNRSITPPPHPQGNLMRRSPRRAPPQYSPSPPSRFARKEKDEYFEGRGRDRYEDRGRFPKPPYGARDFEGKYDGQPTKFDASMSQKSDIQSIHKSDSQRQPIRSYHSNMPHGHEHDQPRDSQFYRDKLTASDIKKPGQDFDTNLLPPGTDANSCMPSLLDINLSRPNSNIYPISTIGTGVTQEHRPLASDYEKSRRDKDSHADSKSALANERKKSSLDDENDSDHRHKKSPTGKKHKKDKRKHKKKSKDEKKTKKRKSSKDERPTDGDKSSEEEMDTETAQDSTKLVPAAVHVKGAVIEQPLGEGIVPDNAFAARQTAPCDSTVKSPERAHDTEAPAVKVEPPTSHAEREKSGSIETRRRDSQTSNRSHGKETNDMKMPSLVPATEELRLPTSKWDEYEDFLPAGDAAKNISTERDIPLATTDSKMSIGERIVTPDVIKRAESLIFDKPVKALSDIPKLIPDVNEHFLTDSTRDAKTTSDIVLPSLIQPTKDMKHSLVASTVYRKSAKDRLGSKVSEDEVVLNVNRTAESAASVKSKISSVVDSSDSTRRRRSRSRSPYASTRYRNRSRSKSLERLINKSRQSSERQINRPSDRDPKSPRRRERRRSNSREKRRSISRERRKPESREQRSPRPKDKKASPPRDIMQRSLSKSRRTPTRDHKRSLSRDRNKRAASRDRRRPGSRDRERERRRSNSRSRRRSRSRSRDRRRSTSRRRGRSRSPRERRHTPSRERDPKYQRSNDPMLKDAIDAADKRRSNVPERRKDMPPRLHENPSVGDQDHSPEARVFQQAGGDLSFPRADQVFSPTLKKQKGRINIKLSSISKTEPQHSGSSSSDEDHEHPGDAKLSDSEKRKNRKGASSTSKSNSRPIVQSTVNVVNGPIISTTKDKENKTKTIEDGVPGEDGKRKKKRTHSPTSTKSSSSSDTKRKKKKKDKKKKKKKKKSKE